MRATYLQTSFLSGEWSTLYQGRIDSPRYKTAMGICYNAIPTEEGAWARRPGTNWVNWTKSGNPAVLRHYMAHEKHGYTCEFTNGYVRFLNCEEYNGINYVGSAETATVTDISTASPAVLTVTPAVTWATGDTIYLRFDDSGLGGSFNSARDPYLNPIIAAQLKNRQLKITRLTSTTFSIKDALTNSNIDGSTLNWTGSTIYPSAVKILEFDGPWTTATLPSIRLIQNSVYGVILDGVHAPQQLDLTPNVTAPTVETAIASGDVSTFTLRDGPYLDRFTPKSGAYLVFALSGGSTNYATLTPKYQTYSATFAYAIGDCVTDGSGNHYVSLTAGNIGNTPSGSPSNWATTTILAAWDTAIETGVGLTSASVGRLIRLFSQPAPWSSAATYAAGDTVTYPAGTRNFYSALTASTTITPGTDAATWVAVDPSVVANWSWGTITAINTGTQVATVLLATNPANSLPIYEWRLGLYGGPTPYPSCGAFHGGRLWLGGALANRIDGSVSGDYSNFSPTSNDGSVSDVNAVSATFNASGRNKIHWMISQETGLLCGTLAGEWMIRPNQSNDPITPTNIDAKRITTYKVADIPPIESGQSIIFVQAYKRKLLEFLPDVFTGKYSAPNLSLAAKHLTTATIKDLAYQDEPVPVAWTLMVDGSLAGMSYRRTSSFASEDPVMNGWHQHALALSHPISSIIAGEPRSAENLSAVTNEAPESGNTPALNFVGYDTDANGGSGAYYVGIQNLIPQGNPRLVECAYLDMVGYPWGSYADTSGGVSGIRVVGLMHLVGKTVTAFAAGLNCGTYTVSASGTIFVPYQSDADQLFTLAYVQALWTAEQALYPGTPTQLKGWGSPFYGFVGCSAITNTSSYVYGVPIVVGLAYTSQGQMLPPVAPQEAGARTGPALGNVRRTHKLSVRVGAGVTGTTTFGTLPMDAEGGDTITNGIVVPFKQADENTELAIDTLFNGIAKFTIKDSYGMNAGIAWSITTPEPLTILAVQGYLDTSED